MTKHIAFALSLALLPGLVLANGTKSFKQLDTDHNGCLSRDEASAWPALAAVFDRADKNKNGCLSKTEYKHAVKMAKNQKSGSMSGGTSNDTMSNGANNSTNPTDNTDNSNTRNNSGSGY